MAVFMNTPEDMGWVAGRFNLPGEWGSAVIHGNEDAPEKVELWYATEPAHNQEPDSILTADTWPWL